MISVDDALDRIFTRIPTPLPESVPIARAHKRVLARPLLAQHTQPPFDASAMDGYAVRAAEIVPGKPFFLAGTSQAGQSFTGMMQSGECVRIFTGAPMPIGADAVIMQEEATAHGNQVSFAKAPRTGLSVRYKGFDFTQGNELLPAGVPLNPAMLNLAASANYAQLEVTKRPRLAVIATGDELVAPGSEIGPGGCRNPAAAAGVDDLAARDLVSERSGVVLRIPAVPQKIVIEPAPGEQSLGSDMLGRDRQARGFAFQYAGVSKIGNAGLLRRRNHIAMLPLALTDLVP